MALWDKSFFWKFRISENDFKKRISVRKLQLDSKIARITQFGQHNSEL